MSTAVEDETFRWFGTEVRKLIAENPDIEWRNHTENDLVRFVELRLPNQMVVEVLFYTMYRLQVSITTINPENYIKVVDQNMPVPHHSGLYLIHTGPGLVDFMASGLLISKGQQFSLHEIVNGVPLTRDWLRIWIEKRSFRFVMDILLNVLRPDDTCL